MRDEKCSDPHPIPRLLQEETLGVHRYKCGQSSTLLSFLSPVPSNHPDLQVQAAVSCCCLWEPGSNAHATCFSQMVAMVML